MDVFCGASALIELKNKRVLVVGLGKSGIAAARFLKARGAQVTVSDIRPAGLIAELPALLDAGIMVETGSHGLLTFRRQDLIVVSPGVPSNTPELTRYARSESPIIGETGTWRQVPPRPDRRDYRIERQDHNNDAHRRDPQGERQADAGWRQHRPSGRRYGRGIHAGELERARGLELPVGDDSDLPSEDRAGAEHHAGSSRPPRQL